MSISKQELELADLQGSIDRISARQDIQEEKIHDCLIGIKNLITVVAEQSNDCREAIKNLITVVEDLMRQSNQCIGSFDETSDFVINELLSKSKQLADETSAICKRLDRIEQRLSDIDDIEERLGQLEDNQ